MSEKKESRFAQLLAAIGHPRPEGGTVGEWARHLRVDAARVWSLVIADELRAVRPTPGDEASGPWRLYSPDAPEWDTIKAAL